MKRFVQGLGILVLILVIASPSVAMTDDQKTSCHLIIHTAATAAAGSATVMAQFPGSDNIALAAIIGTMTYGLAEVFDISLGQASAETVGIAILTYFGGAITARIISQWIAGWIPLAGNALNAATMASLVEYIGWTIADAFDSGEWATWKIATAIGGTIIAGGEGKKVPVSK